MWEFPFVPRQASTVAPGVDAIFWFVTGLAVLFAVPVTFLIIYFAIRYRRGAPAPRLRRFTEGRGAHPTWVLETAWIAVPFLLAMGVFTAGARMYIHTYQLPSEGMDIYVVGRMWMWKFQHPTGQLEINTLHVPVGQVVRLTMISQDVIHSFYVPAFRIKRDVLPGYYSTLWFEATEVGEFHLFCAEYCGTEHSDMVGRIIVMEPNQYQAWLTEEPVGTLGELIGEASSGARTTGQEPVTMAGSGADLFEASGCSSCHRMDGSGAGPSLVGVYGQPVELEDGSVVTADAQYIRESIIHPNAKIVAGYPAIMPSYDGQLSEEELLALVEYVRALGPDAGGAATPPANTAGAAGDSNPTQGEQSGTGGAGGTGATPLATATPGSAVRDLDSEEQGVQE